MTTYTKQLKDENGNTIYPDVGIPLDDVLFGDTVEEVTPQPWVNTTEIIDEAVTSPKIDFSTITEDMKNMPMAHTTCGIGYGITAELYRVGNMVWCTQESIVTTAINSDFTSAILTETIPAGYRPRCGTSFHSQFQDGNQYNITWRLTTEGGIILTTRGSYGAIRFGINAFWFTTDTYPTGDIPS